VSCFKLMILAVGGLKIVKSQTDFADAVKYDLEGFRGPMASCVVCGLLE
jgi:hypothetical protein